MTRISALKTDNC